MMNIGCQQSFQVFNILKSRLHDDNVVFKIMSNLKDLLLIDKIEYEKAKKVCLQNENNVELYYEMKRSSYQLYCRKLLLKRTDEEGYVIYNFEENKNFWIFVSKSWKKLSPKFKNNYVIMSNKYNKKIMKLINGNEDDRDIIYRINKDINYYIDICVLE